MTKSTSVQPQTAVLPVWVAEDINREATRSRSSSRFIACYRHSELAQSERRYVPDCAQSMIAKLCNITDAAALKAKTQEMEIVHAASAANRL